MNTRNLNHCLLSLFATLTLCAGTAQAEIVTLQEGHCKFKKYPAEGEVFSWAITYYTDEQRTEYTATIGSTELDGFKFNADSKKDMLTHYPNDAIRKHTSDMRYLTNVFGIKARDLTLTIPHSDTTPTRLVGADQIVSIGKNFTQDSTSGSQLWTLVYKKPDKTMNCHADLLCTVTGIGIKSDAKAVEDDGKKDDKQDGGCSIS
jgi:hypothetical protein